MNTIRRYITFEFHTSAAARKKYKLEEDLFTITGDLIVADFTQARQLADKINQLKKSEGITDKLTTPGQVNALGLIHEIFHYLIGYYEEKINPGVFSRSLGNLKNKLGDEETDKVLLEFINEFPPLNVFNGNIKPEDYLIGTTGNKSNKEILIEEILLLYLQNNNPATSNLADLYTDKFLAEKSKYLFFLDLTENFFVSEKPFGKENLPLVQFLRKPIISNPYDIENQLEFIFKEWGVFIYEKFGARLLGGKDLIHEDYKLFVKHGGGEKGTPPVPTYEFDEEYFKQLKAKLLAGENLSPEELLYYQNEYEKFTADIEWMPRVVMLAKNTHVWMDQLSKKYQRSITRLDQIPDEELDQIAGWNFTALWLIGIWERSTASRKIKHYTGNSEAVSSAYSLFDYVIANDLGGEPAFYNLKERAASRGIRMASDMVPNHTGIYSKWVIEKPYYFIQRDEPPYPSYTFFGADLSDDERVAVRIEDKYYSHSDAAVVFQRVDKYTGDTKYIYHGNDGTNMPWNDTAQLNLLIPEVRESLYQTIKHVAKMFPIIRFDAAMTLSKKHYQRLWFPIPGTAGAVPSRADYAMTREQFDTQMPNEFWREVVDRMNEEMPDTLLLAEAFWLMEGYFVRTLGMHRVYNSAFMHMMMKEENEKYRLLIKNTLDFNPEILKRYVNFMSNPDEETAVNQFGKGDKYFGVCVMMITMPGLPMFGHGQIEGFSEKYGMEYKRAYYNEFADENLVNHHKHQIFPLMKKRYLFSQVENFEFFDFVDDSGNVNESVFAYTNTNGYERSLVIYNNSYQECYGTIKYSIDKLRYGVKSSKSLGQALNINPDFNVYYIFKDYRTSQEYITPGRDIHNFGRYFYLKGYQYSVFLDYREVYDSDGTYANLNEYLNGRGVYSIEEAKTELKLTPLHQKISSLLQPEILSNIKSYIFNEDNKAKIDETFLTGFFEIADEINKLDNNSLDKTAAKKQLIYEIDSFKAFYEIFDKKNKSKRKINWFEEVKSDFVINSEKGNNSKNIIILSLIFKNLLSEKTEENGNILFDKYLLDRILPLNLNNLSSENFDGYDDYLLVKTLSTKPLFNKLEEQIKFNPLKLEDESGYEKLTDGFKSSMLELFELQEIKNFIEVHKFENISYFNKEKFERLNNYIFSLYNIFSTLKFDAKPKRKTKTSDISKLDKSSIEKFVVDELKNSHGQFSILRNIAEETGYKFDFLLKEFSQTSGLKKTVKNAKKKTQLKKNNLNKKTNKKVRGKVE
jgi:glycosidase